MATASEVWYVRLPDGRILRARSTESMRHHLKAGRIPWESRARRSGEEAWQTLDQFQDFTDLAAAALEETANDSAPKNKTRGAGPELRTLGMRGLLEELVNAFDSCLQKAKLITAGITGLGIGIALVLAEVGPLQMPAGWGWAALVGVALAVLVLFSICTAILTQMTALELSRFRPARFSEIRAGLTGAVARLTCALALVSGSLIGVIVLLRLAPGWLAPAGPDAAWVPPLLNLIHGARLTIEAICWPIFGFAMLLMGPTLLVEDLSIRQGMRQWLGMLRQHLGRIYLYQAVAFAFAAMLTLPVLVPVLIAFGIVTGQARELSVGEMVPFRLLLGLAMTPMLAYLLVAHVFIYLNLRYEFFYSARER